MLQSVGFIARVAALLGMVLGGTLTANAAMEIWGGVTGCAPGDVSLPLRDIMWEYLGWQWAAQGDSGKTKPGAMGGVDRYPWPIAGVPPTVQTECPTDSNGYPLEVPYKWRGGGTVAGGGDFRPVKSLLWQVPVKVFPFGTYTLIAEGKGRIDLGWAKDTTLILNGGKSTFQIPVKSMPALNIFNPISLNVGQGQVQSGLTITIVRSEKGDHVRNIHLIRPDDNGGTSWANDFETCPFNPKWLEEMRLFKVLRFMGWDNSNSNCVVKWSDRITMTSTGNDKFNKDEGILISVNAVPYELQIKACNALGADYWVNVPARADEDFVRKLAQLCLAQLNPARKVYVEWANETWNGSFIGNRSTPFVSQNYCPAATDFYRAHAYMAARNTGIFREVMGASRIVGVLSGQAAGSGVLDKIVDALSDPSINPKQIKMDAGATAPYFESSGRNAGWSAGLKATCQRANLRMLMYEVNMEKGKGPALYEVFKTALRDFQSDGFECFNAFVGIAGWGQWGNWGFKEYIGQPLDSAYKYKAIWEFAIANKTFDPNAAIPGCSGVSSVDKHLQPGAAQRPANRPQIAGAVKHNLRGQIIARGSLKRGSVGLVMVGSKGMRYRQVEMVTGR